MMMSVARRYAALKVPGGSSPEGRKLRGRGLGRTGPPARRGRAAASTK